MATSGGESGEHRGEAPGGDRIPVLERRGAFESRDDWPSERWCRLESALEVVGTRSAMILIREVFFGSTKFDELVRRTGLSEAVAAGRLKELVAHGLLEREPYRDPGARTRYEYVLTERGSRLFPLVVALMEWGELLREDAATGVELVHRECGSVLAAVVECESGHRVDLGEAGVQLKREWPQGAGRSLG